MFILEKRLLKGVRGEFFSEIIVLKKKFLILGHSLMNPEFKFGLATAGQSFVKMFHPCNNLDPVLAFQSWRH